MRAFSLASLGLLVLALASSAQADKSERYGIPLDTRSFPQGTPKDAFSSFIRAIENKKFEYLVAHLADPAHVDDRVKRIYGGKFDEQVQDTRSRLGPVEVKLLK